MNKYTPSAWGVSRQEVATAIDGVDVVVGVVCAVAKQTAHSTTPTPRTWRGLFSRAIILLMISYAKSTEVSNQSLCCWPRLKTSTHTYILSHIYIWSDTTLLKILPPHSASSPQLLTSHRISTEEGRKNGKKLLLLYFTKMLMSQEYLSSTSVRARALSLARS